MKTQDSRKKPQLMTLASTRLCPRWPRSRCRTSAAQPAICTEYATRNATLAGLGNGAVGIRVISSRPPITSACPMTTNQSEAACGRRTPQAMAATAARPVVAAVGPAVFG